MSTIAIAGATGKLGRLTIQKLIEKNTGAQIVALARTPAKAADLGVEVREADYNRPETLATALKGVDVLLLISSNELGQRRVEQQGAVIDAAKKANVGRIVYTSLLHSDTSSIRLLANDHEATEKLLKASGVPYTILRNGWYTENLTASVPGAVAAGALIGASGEGKFSGAARADYAEAAAVLLAGEGHENKVYELAGDSAFTRAELAAEISRQTGKAIPYRNLTEGEYAAALQKFGFAEPMANAYAHFDTCAAEGALFDDSKVLSKLIGRATTPLSSTVAEVLKG